MMISEGHDGLLYAFNFPAFRAGAGGHSVQPVCLLQCDTNYGMETCLWQAIELAKGLHLSRRGSYVCGCC